MTFLSPLFLLGAVTAVVPVVLHFLHRQPEARVKFSAVHLLRHAPIEDTRRRRLREWLILALRVSALALLALAFARPFFVSTIAGAAGRVTVVALDTSMSVSAPAEFARAKQLAKQAIAKAGSDDLIGVVTFADVAQTAAAPTTDRALAIAAVDTASAGFGSTRYRAAIGAAAQMAEASGATRSTIVVVTDLQASGWDAGDRAAIPESARVELVDVGPAPADLAVTAAHGAGDTVIATVRSTDSAPRDVHVRLAVDGRNVSEATVSLGPASASDVELSGAHGQAAVVSVDDPSGIQGDNARYVLLGDETRPSVLVVTTNGDIAREAFYVQQALASAGSGTSYQLDGVSAAKVGGWNGAAGETAAVLMLSTHGLDAKGREVLSGFLRSGGGLFVAAGPDVDGDVVQQILGGGEAVPAGVPDRGGVSAERTMTPTDVRHPVFQAFGARAASLGLVKFHQVSVFARRECATIAMFSTGEAALTDCTVGEGRALVLASDLDNHGNDFPLHPSFVPFVHEVVRYLSGGRERAADVLVTEVPKGVPPVPGIAALPGAAGRGRRLVAVNVDPRESDFERVTADEFQAAVARLKDAARSAVQLQASQQENRQHLWQYALLLAIGALVAESFVSARAA